jgi:hypothetical protein
MPKEIRVRPKSRADRRFLKRLNPRAWTLRPMMRKRTTELAQRIADMNDSASPRYGNVNHEPNMSVMGKAHL